MEVAASGAPFRPGSIPGLRIKQRSNTHQTEDIVNDELNELKERMAKALEALSGITSSDCDFEVFIQIQAACDLLRDDE
jgi:hypothetical protein